MSAKHAQAIVLTLAATLFTSTVPLGQAHTMTLAYSGYSYVLVAANGGYNALVLNNLGPAEKTWVINYWFGLDGGDNHQYARFVWMLKDNTNPYYYVVNANGAFEWITNGDLPIWGQLFSDSITIHASATIDLELWIYNTDSASQLFYFVDQSWYY